MHKSYGDTVAVDDVSFTVQEGEIFGIPGPTAPTSRISEIDISLAVSPHGAGGGDTSVPPPLVGVVSVVTRAALITDFRSGQQG